MAKYIRAFLQGRLGNQLFVYAAARAAQEKYFNGNSDLFFDDCRFINDNSLLNYNLKNNVKFGKVFMGKAKEVVFYNFYERFAWTNARKTYNISKRIQRLYNFFNMFICKDGYIPLPSRHTKIKKIENLDMCGFFQTEKYFKEIRPLLLKELTPKNPVLEKNIQLIEDIQKTESCCISVRLGDYVNNPVHYVCTKEYYQAAIDKMICLHPNTVFYLFSDDVQLAKKSLNLPENTIYEEGNDPDYEALRVMSNCQHFILANSSFSWWAQWLSTRENKTVIAPDKWYNTDVPCDIYQKEWILIPVQGEKV